MAANCSIADLALVRQTLGKFLYRCTPNSGEHPYLPRHLIFLVDENICIFFKRIPPRPRLSVPVLLAGLRRGNECLRRQAGHACELRRKLRGRGERTGRFAKAHCEVFAPTSAYSYTQAPPRPGKILSIYLPHGSGLSATKVGPAAGRSISNLAAEPLNTRESITVT